MLERPTLILTDDDPDALRLLSKFLEHRGYQLRLAHSAKETLEILEREPVHLVLTDLMMPNTNGVELTKEIKRRNPEIVVMIITAFASIETAVQAMRAGAFDYINKPVIPDELNVKVTRALEQFALRQEVSVLKGRLARSVRPPDLIGESPQMQRVLQMVGLVARRDVPVVMLGESGTGKELVARAVHNLSPRSSRPFVPINCAAVPETLLESELFGYQKGAFTGATSSRKGLFEEAHGGTLFLDEIADAPLTIQMKLLRALQDGQIRRLGSNQAAAFDVRILVATNRKLDQEVAGGRFREDLYYRLSVVTIQIPPLRERKEDIPLLINHFIRSHAPAINPSVKSISPEAQHRLVQHDWPGNVRELENTIRRALVLCRADVITPEDVVHLGPKGPQPKTDGPTDLSTAHAEFLRSYFLQALERRRGNIRQVAEDAGLSRKSVYEQLKKLHIDPSLFRGHA
jgi:DNA-binding NtrC family response regulator